MILFLALWVGLFWWLIFYPSCSQHAAFSPFPPWLFPPGAGLYPGTVSRPWAFRQVLGGLRRCLRPSASGIGGAASPSGPSGSTRPPGPALPPALHLACGLILDRLEPPFAGAQLEVEGLRRGLRHRRGGLSIGLHPPTRSRPPTCPPSRVRANPGPIGAPIRRRARLEPGGPAAGARPAIHQAALLAPPAHQAYPSTCPPPRVLAHPRPIGAPIRGRAARGRGPLPLSSAFGAGLSSRHGPSSTLPPGSRPRAGSSSTDWGAHPWMRASRSRASRWSAPLAASAPSCSAPASLGWPSGGGLPARGPARGCSAAIGRPGPSGAVPDFRPQDCRDTACWLVSDGWSLGRGPSWVEPPAAPAAR